MLHSHDPRFVGRPTGQPDRPYLAEAIATATALDGKRKFIAEISWVEMTGGWFAAWHSKPAPAGGGKLRRAPRLDAANTMDLGRLIGEVITVGCLNYGENGVLDPVEQVTLPTRDQMFQRLRAAILASDPERGIQIMKEMDALGMGWH